MLRSWSTIVALLVLCSCAEESFRAPQGVPPVVSPDYSSIPGVLVPHLVKPAQIHGEYRVGDGLGYNLQLILKEEATYSCTWHGCLGIYGTAEGSWSVDGATVLLSPTKETAMLQGYLRRLDVISYRGHLLLISERDRESVIADGPWVWYVLHHDDATEDLLR